MLLLLCNHSAVLAPIPYKSTTVKVNSREYRKKNCPLYLSALNNHFNCSLNLNSSVAYFTFEILFFRHRNLFKQFLNPRDATAATKNICRLMLSISGWRATIERLVTFTTVLHIKCDFVQTNQLPTYSNLAEHLRHSLDISNAMPFVMRLYATELYNHFLRRHQFLIICLIKSTRTRKIVSIRLKIYNFQ